MPAATDRLMMLSRFPDTAGHGGGGAATNRPARERGVPLGGAVGKTNAAEPPPSSKARPKLSAPLNPAVGSLPHLFLDISKDLRLT